MDDALKKCFFFLRNENLLLYNFVESKLRSDYEPQATPWTIRKKFELTNF
jgi:hypothetical protein